MRLYEINEAIESVILRGTIYTTGEFDPDESLEKELTHLQMDKAEKILNIACYIKALEAEAKAHKEEEQAQKHKRQMLENKANRLKEFLKGALDVGDKFNDSRISVAYRDNGQQKLVIDMPVEEMPKGVLKYDVDKAKLKEYIICDEMVWGHIAHLEPSDPSLVIK